MSITELTMKVFGFIFGGTVGITIFLLFLFAMSICKESITTYSPLWRDVVMFIMTVFCFLTAIGLGSLSFWTIYIGIGG